MSDMNLFERAARCMWRYPSDRGELTTEQLFQLPLKALDKVARAVNADLKAVTEESFIDVKPNPEHKVLEYKLEVVKYVIAVQMKAAADAADRKDKADKRRKILEALADREDEALRGKTKEELLQELEALDAA